MNERGSARYPLIKGRNVDSDGVARDVYFVLHDISDEDLAEEFGVAWAGGLVGTPEAATSDAIYHDGLWTFFGDLPNPVPAIGSPDQSADNTYTPLRRVEINGKSVVVNATYVNWGAEPWEQLRIDHSCVSFPDDPPNTGCKYNGSAWGDFESSGHALEIHTGLDRRGQPQELHSLLP